jgi:NTP pyrophosphatase (non-canonical NTP hydrolase)
MTLNEYQAKALETAIYPNIGKNLIYPTFKLCGEAGEVAEKMGKAIRDDGGIITSARREDLIKELGDVQWYLAVIAFELGTTLEEVAQRNVDKLLDRKERGVLGGSGDNR